MTDEELEATEQVSEWRPITNIYQLGLLGKLCEEANELGAACARSIIQGLDEQVPNKDYTNREWLENEIADVYALADAAVDRLKLNTIRIAARVRAKRTFKAPWFRWLLAEAEQESYNPSDCSPQT